MNPDRSALEFVLMVALAIAGLVICTRVLRRFLKGLGRGPTRSELEERDEYARAEHDALPKCICGEVATDPIPILKRSRGALDWLRNVFAAPPRYKRMVDMMQPPVLCKVHAHVADARMDQFIFNIRASCAELNSKIASEAAAFEQEELMRQIGDSLTDNQKRAVRKSIIPLRILPARTGTDDATISPPDQS